MAKYRIRVESIDGNEELDEQYVNGIECDGFAILADKNGAGRTCVAVHRINLVTLAAIIHSSDIFQNAQKLNMVVTMMDRLNGFAEKKEPDEKEEFLRRVIGSLDAE